jgi:ABC-type amino acid transport substrate-binding protein
MTRKDIGSIFSMKRGSVWLHCTKAKLSDELIERLRKSTDALRKEGAFDKLIKRYIPAVFE